MESTECYHEPATGQREVRIHAWPAQLIVTKRRSLCPLTFLRQCNMICCPAWHLPGSDLDPDEVVAKVNEVQVQLRQAASTHVYQVVVRHRLQPHPDRVLVPLGLLHHLLPHGGA